MGNTAIVQIETIPHTPEAIKARLDSEIFNPHSPVTCVSMDIISSMRDRELPQYRRKIRIDVAYNLKVDKANGFSNLREFYRYLVDKGLEEEEHLGTTAWIIWGNNEKGEKVRKGFFWKPHDNVGVRFVPE